MASKERLYELWMLYYTKVSASAEEDLTLTPVVAAAEGFPAPPEKRTHVRTHTQADTQNGTFEFPNASA